MTTIPASKTRIPPATFNQVAYQGERVRVERRGGDAVYLISADDLALLEKAEDQYWSAQGIEALKAFEASGEKPVPWGKTKAKRKGK